MFSTHPFRISSNTGEREEKRERCENSFIPLIRPLGHTQYHTSWAKLNAMWHFPAKTLADGPSSACSSALLRNVWTPRWSGRTWIIESHLIGVSGTQEHKEERKRVAGVPMWRLSSAGSSRTWNHNTVMREKSSKVWTWLFPSQETLKWNDPFKFCRFAILQNRFQSKMKENMYNLKPSKL